MGPSGLLPVPPEATVAEVDVDVVVVGAGAAGLSATLAAVQQGASVLVAEADGGFRKSCNTSMTASMIPGAGTPQQAAAGVEDSAADFLADVVAKTKGTVYMPLARRLTAVSAEVVRWLSESCDVPMELATDIRYPGHRVARCHSVPDRRGSTLHGLLVERAMATESATMVTARRVVGLRSGEPGPGDWTVDLGRPDGTVEPVGCRSVILAAGGFGGSPELVRTHLGEIAGAFYFGSPFHRGDALALTKGLHPLVGCMDSYQGHGSVAVPNYIPVPWPVVMEGGFLVNAEGRRFGDESQGYSGFARHVIAQPGGVAWVIFDGRIDARMMTMPDYRSVRREAALHWSDTIEELALAIGVGGDDLSEAATQARAAASGERSDPFGRTDWGQPLVPPYAAVRVTGTLHHTQGGLLVDDAGSVIGPAGSIDGLYATGGSAVGISGTGSDGYLAGNGLIAAVGLGFVAGRHAGERATSSQRQGA